MVKAQEIVIKHREIRCPECWGSGHKISKEGKWAVCPKCNGTRKIVHTYYDTK